MEGFLRIGLLLVAGTIIFLIVLHSWQARRRRKMPVFTTSFSTTLDADAVLGLEPREPIIGTIHAPVETHQALEPIFIPEDDAQLSLNFNAPAVEVQPEAPKTKKKSTESDYKKDLLVISVVAQRGKPFVSYDLLQAISSTGMQFGDMNIFHYYDQTPGGRITLFSLASATEPGDFDLDRIGEFSCTGLTLFTNLREVPDPQHAFEQMLMTAEELAEDLEGELRAGMREPWNDDVQDLYQQKVLQYQTNHA